MRPVAGNIFDAVPTQAERELVGELWTAPGLRVERIVSTGQASPPGFWYDQEWAEWVLVLQGAAGLLFAGETEPRVLHAGDYLPIPAHCRHRIAWTAADQATIWLAIHHRPD